MAADEAKSEKKTNESQDSKEEIRMEPFLDMRDPTFRCILQAATSKYTQMLCPR